MAKTLTGYRFLTKNPVIDLYRTARERSGKSIEKIAEESGVTVQTLKKWEYGETRTPRHITIRFAMYAAGYDETWHNPQTGDTLIANYAKPNRPQTMRQSRPAKRK